MSKKIKKFKINESADIVNSALMDELQNVKIELEKAIEEGNSDDIVNLTEKANELMQKEQKINEAKNVLDSMNNIVINPPLKNVPKNVVKIDNNKTDADELYTNLVDSFNNAATVATHSSYIPEIFKEKSLENKANMIIDSLGDEIVFESVKNKKGSFTLESDYEFEVLPDFEAGKNADGTYKKMQEIEVPVEIEVNYELKSKMAIIKVDESLIEYANKVINKIEKRCRALKINTEHKLVYDVLKTFTEVPVANITEFEEQVHNLKQCYKKGAKLYMNQKTHSHFISMKDSTGRPLFGEITEAKGAIMFGYSVKVLDDSRLADDEIFFGQLSEAVKGFKANTESAVMIDHSAAFEEDMAIAKAKVKRDVVKAFTNALKRLKYTPASSARKNK